VELASCSTYVLSWKLCINGKEDLVWAYAGCDNICFNNKIKNNKLLAIKVEEEHRMTLIKILSLKSNIILSMGNKSQSKVEVDKPFESYPFVFFSFRNQKGSSICWGHLGFSIAYGL
jgi:hypothetical protein